MSFGTPVGARYMRLRHSQGSASSGDDVDDDASSSPHSFAPPSPIARSWIEIVLNMLWVASAVFIVYFGDTESNFIYLLWHDGRIRRLPLYFGMACVGVNIVIFFCTSTFSWSLQIFDLNWELLSTSALPFVTLMGLLSFCLLSFALWPIWSFLTLPLLFTLFMACMVIFPHSVIGNLRSPNDSFRID